jgi:hypothetical protein
VYFIILTIKHPLSRVGWAVPNIWHLTWRMSYKRQKLPTLYEHLWSPRFIGEIRVAHLFLCFLFVFCLSSSSVLFAQCCQYLWSVHLWMLLRFSLTCIRLMPGEKGERRVYKVIHVRENRRSIHKWTDQRYWQHWANKTEDEDKQNTKRKHKKKMSYTDLTNKPGWSQVLVKSRQFLPLIGHPPC